MEHKNKESLIKGITYCIIAHLMLAIMGACAKYLAEFHHIIEIIFYRNTAIFIALALFIVITRKKSILHTHQPKLTAARGILGIIGLFFTFSAIAMLPIAYATVIFFTSSILTPILAFVFLKENIRIHHWSAIAIGMCGVLIIAQPSGAISLTGLIFGLLAACIHGFMFTILRGLKKQNAITTTFYFILLGTVLPGFAMPWVWNTIASEHIWIFALTALSGGIGQLCLANAYKHAPAVVVTPFGYSALIWTILIDIFIWHYTLDYFAIFAGTALILVAQLYIVYQESKHQYRNQT